MSATVAARYPGAQPFSDDSISRSVFFGRSNESRALVDQIFVSRLVVVYAKSGIGKTSLLQAGVAEPLREEGYLPLFVRVNDLKQGPLRSVFGGVEASATRQKVEYKSGNEQSLWHFFKTVEFWHDDRLLTPVLILDQFEELFTLHPPEARAGFLRELGFLVRGSRPDAVFDSSHNTEPHLKDTPPEMRIVISLREDYLGSLEEASDSIPQILDRRFRLTALTVKAGRAAMEEPAKVHDSRLMTQPFAYKGNTIDLILAYLSQRAAGSVVHQISDVEPFHLQLICQRVEAIVAERQRSGGNSVEIDLTDLGGALGLRAILSGFYENVLSAIRVRRTRIRVHRLCEHYLISPGGRRLSLEQAEIQRILKLDPVTLRYLVDRRLLRSDQRAENWYYELSHDSLVQPILANRKPQAIAVAVLGLFLAIFLGFVAFSLLLSSVVAPIALSLVQEIEEERLPVPATIALAVFYLLFGLFTAWGCRLIYRRSIETINRYRKRSA